MKKQNGFTLIELVVVIVLLAILGVVAAPKYLDLQSDARASSLIGLQGALKGASSIIYGKAAVTGVEKSATMVVVDGVDTIYGYPTASTTGIEATVDGLGTGGDWASFTTNTANSISYTFNGREDSGLTDDANTGCHVTYTQANASASVNIQVYSGGC